MINDYDPARRRLAHTDRLVVVGGANHISCGH